MRLFRLRRAVKRFGIAAPRVAVKTEVAWYWRWLGISLLGLAALVIANWAYDAGRRYAGFDRTEIEQELARVREAAEAARSDLEQLRAVANAADSKLAIERTAQQRLAEQVRGLERENASLREELAIFESMLAANSRDPSVLAIQRFKVEPDAAPGEYRYRLMLLAPGKRTERGFQGRLELLVHLTEAGRSAMMVLPEKGTAGAFQLAFKQFRRVEGIFKIPPKAQLESVQVRVYESGSEQAKATQTATPR